MNILLTSILIISLSMLPAQASAAASTYYVTQNGNGSRTGKSLGNAWAASDFNNSINWDMSENTNKIDPGDTVYFAGTFSTRLVIKNGGTSGNQIILDGYEGGDCDPSNSVCSSSALLSEGMDIGSNYCGPDYITIQDFRMTCSSAVGTKVCFQIYPDVSESDGSGWSEGMIVQRNYVYETHGTMAYFARTKYLTVDSNKFTHFGQGRNATQGVNFITNEDTIIQNNEFGHDENSYPSDCTSANTIEFHGTQRALIQYNDIYGAPNGAGLTLKENGFRPYSGDIDDVVIRFNKVHDNGYVLQGEKTGKGIGSKTRDGQSISYVYIYGNFVYNNYHEGILVGTEADHNYIWSNIVTNNGRMNIISSGKTGETPPDHIYIYNNTIGRGNTGNETDNTRGGVVLINGTNIHVKNNALWNNRPAGAGSKYNQIYSSTSLSSLEHNTLYHGSSTANYYYNGAVRTIATMMKTFNFEDDAPAGVIEDSGFKDPDGADNTHGTADDDYTLNGMSISNGADLSKCFDVVVQGKNYNICYDDALDPNATNWKKTPPKVKTTKQRDHGAWERGAYVYRTDIPSKIKSPPSGLRVKKFKKE